MTERNARQFEFQPLGRRDVVAAFDGGRVTSDAAAILLREVEERFRFLDEVGGVQSLGDLGTPLDRLP